MLIFILTFSLVITAFKKKKKMENVIIIILERKNYLYLLKDAVEIIIFKAFNNNFDICVVWKACLLH